MKRAFVVQNNEEFVGYLNKNLDLLGVNLLIEYEEMCKDIIYDYVVVNNISETVKEVKGNYIFVNMDMEIDNILFNGNLITYGLGNKNTVTLSSMAEDKSSFVYCMQRYITEDVIPGEIPIIKSFKDNYELYAFMISITIGLIEGVSIEKIYK